MEKDKEEVQMDMTADFLNCLVELTTNPDLMESMVSEGMQLVERGKEWLCDPVDEPEGIQEIRSIARALIACLNATLLPLSAGSIKLSGAMDIVVGEALSRAYSKGRKDAMAEMVLCADSPGDNGECPNDTQ